MKKIINKTILALILALIFYSSSSAKIYEIKDNGRVDFNTVTNQNVFLLEVKSTKNRYAYVGASLPIDANLSFTEGFITHKASAAREDAIANQTCSYVFNNIENTISCSKFSITPTQAGDYIFKSTLDTVTGLRLEKQSATIRVKSPYTIRINCDDTDNDSSKILLKQSEKINCKAIFTNIDSELKNTILQIKELDSTATVDLENPPGIINFPIKVSTKTFDFNDELSISFTIDSLDDIKPRIDSEELSTTYINNLNTKFLTRFLYLRLNKKIGSFDELFEKFMYFTEEILIDTGITAE